MKLNHRLTVTALPAAMALLSSHALAQGMAGMGPGGQIQSPYAGMYGSMGNVYRPYYRQFHFPGMAGMTGMAAPAQATDQAPAQATPGMPGPAFTPGSAAYPAPMPGAGAPGAAPYPSPYAGMYGSMGNVYSPYYQFHFPGMAGMTGMAAPAQGTGQAPAQATPGTPGPAFSPGSAAYPAPMPGAGAPGAAPYPSPYEGMYGSMGNVYSPYYRQFHFPGMAGMTGMAAPAQATDQAPAQATPGMPGPTVSPGSAAYPAPTPGAGAPSAAPYPNPYGGMYGSMGNVYSPYYRQFHNPGMASPKK